MNKREAIQAMLEGKKVMHEAYSTHAKYFSMSEDCTIQDSEGYFYSLGYLPSEGWYIYQEPPKTKKVKFYRRKWVYDTELKKLRNNISYEHSIEAFDEVWSEDIFIKSHEIEEIEVELPEEIE